MSAIDPIGQALRFDPLSAAEQMTGSDYKTDEATLALGMFLNLGSSTRKRQLLEENRDTHYSIGFDEARAVFSDLGFQELLVIPKSSRYDKSPETYLIAWSEDGILLDADSYKGHLNSGKVHYNWLPNDGIDRWDFTSSGRGYDGGVWVGDHPIVEGIRYNIQRMRANGRFLNPWLHQPFLWLNPAEAEDYKAATAAIIAQLPQDVRDAIGAVAS